MKIKTSELTGAQLDWAVATSAELTIIHIKGGFPYVPKYPTIGGQRFSPSTDWSQGGPIIEREKVSIDWSEGNNWCASVEDSRRPQSADTPLIAAMRCYVASQLGDEVELPKEL